MIENIKIFRGRPPDDKNTSIGCGSDISAFFEVRPSQCALPLDGNLCTDMAETDTCQHENSKKSSHFEEIGQADTPCTRTVDHECRQVNQKPVIEKSEFAHLPRAHTPVGHARLQGINTCGKTGQRKRAAIDDVFLQDGDAGGIGNDNL